MTLDVFAFFMAGILGEIALLWESAQRGGSKLAGRFGAPVSIARFTALAAILVAIGFSLSASPLGLDQVIVSLDDLWVGYIFAGLGLFVLAVGLVSDVFLPRVGERSVIAVQILVVLFTVTAQRTPAWPLYLALTALPLIGSLSLAISRRNLSPAVQALVYFGYLLALLALTLQVADLGLFEAVRMDHWQALAFGGLFFFLAVHTLFILRFFLIVSSLLIPRNRPLAAGIMPRLFSSEQVSFKRFGLFTLLLSALVLLNNWLNLLPAELLAGLAVMMGVQVMESE